MFTDLRGFTGVSERLDPGELIRWLNGYMDSMTRLVMKHGGVIDDYAGDGLKADFGVPVSRTTEAEIRQDAVNAVNCALAMEKELVKINQVCQEKNLPTMAIRVGIFTGSVIAGCR